MYGEIVLFTMPNEWIPSEAYQTFQVKDGESIECGSVYNNNYFVLDYGVTKEGNWFRCIDLQFVAILETDLELNGAYDNFDYKLLYSYENRIFKDKTTIVNRYTIVQHVKSMPLYDSKHFIIVPTDNSPVKIVYEDNTEFEFNEDTHELIVKAKYKVPYKNMKELIDAVRASNS